MQLSKDELTNLSDLFEPAVKAYHEGRDAANTMLSLQTCPYEALSLERKAWMRGYHAVRDEDYKRNSR